jgi:MscS family membrane protein
MFLHNRAIACVVSCCVVALLVLGMPTTLALGEDVTAAPGATPGGRTEAADPTRATLVQPVRTDSPRETVRTFLRLVEEMEIAALAYRRFRNRLNYERILILEPQFVELIDLSDVPKASRWDVGVDTSAYLLDILGRIDLPKISDVPDARAFDERKETSWRIPGTPLRIVQVKDGPREGEFLFGPRTPDVAPVFHKRISHLPLRSDIGIVSWHGALLHNAGPSVPLDLIRAMPEPMTRVWLDTPVWKIGIVLALVLFSSGLVVLLHKALRLYRPRNRALRFLRRTVTPLVVIGLALTLKAFVSYEIEVLGAFASVFNAAVVVVVYVCAVVALWLLVAALSELIIQSPKIPDDSLDAHLLRLSSRVLSFLGAVVLLANAGQTLGLPVFSILAGLGIGGLAVALAVRPSLENLISGVMLYLDRPVRVGDYCRFGDQSGKVEHIGMRTTRIRTLDRSLISVPNSVFADKEIENWANCDKMQIRTVIGLRYETEPDQLRHVLAKLREMLVAHPQIDPDTVRVRFVDYGASSLDVEVRVYALTREWNEFFAIREDVLLRVGEIVRASGCGFAFPSQTVYMRRDAEPDSARTAEAIQEVRAWRAARSLPFPDLAPERAAALRGTLDYPPHGSANSPPGGTSASDTDGAPSCPRRNGEAASPLGGHERDFVRTDGGAG